MDDFGTKHLEAWLEREFREEDERDSVRKLITELWNSDEEYFLKSGHSYWDLLDIAKRNLDAVRYGYQRRVETGGGMYCGVQEGGAEDIVLFNTKTGDTLALKASELTVEAVRQKIQESNVQHAKGAKA